MWEIQVVAENLSKTQTDLTISSIFNECLGLTEYFGIIYFQFDPNWIDIKIYWRGKPTLICFIPANTGHMSTYINLMNFSHIFVCITKRSTWNGGGSINNDFFVMWTILKTKNDWWRSIAKVERRVASCEKWIMYHDSFFSFHI